MAKENCFLLADKIMLQEKQWLWSIESVSFLIELYQVEDYILPKLISFKRLIGWNDFKSVFLPNIHNYVQSETIFKRTVFLPKFKKLHNVLSKSCQLKIKPQCLIFLNFKTVIFLKPTLYYCTFLDMWKQIHFDC